MARAYLPIYFSYTEQLAMLPDDERGRLVMQLLDYAQTGSLPELTPASAAAMLFSCMRSQIDRDTANYNAKCEKNRSNIKSRWCKRDTTEYDGIRTNTNDTKEKEREKEKEIILLQPAAGEIKKRFIPPSLAEVSSYCAERGNRVDAQQFLDFYEARGWMCGRARMKDWRAAVRTWERSHDSGQNAETERPKFNFVD